MTRGAVLAAISRRGLPMTSYRSHTFATLSALVLLALMPNASAQSSFETTPTTFSGQAAAVKGTILGVPITVVDTGPVDVGGAPSRPTSWVIRTGRIACAVFP